jgi:capsular polysaccharide biosynthesis protein
VKEQQDTFSNNVKQKPIKQMEEYSESSYYFIKLIIKWKKHFMIVTAVAIAAAAVFSSEFIMKPKYKSFAIIYPANVSAYGAESSTEQLLQLLESADIRNTVIHKFKLADHYDIDTTVKGGLTRLYEAYESHVDVKRTEYESIEIKVLDTDPQEACDIVNEIINALNFKARKLQRDKTQEVLVITENHLKLKTHQLDSLTTLLQGLRVKYQILDYGVQVKEVVKSYLKALSGGKNSGGLKDFDVMMRNLEEKGGEYYEAIRVYDAILGQYIGVKTDYENVQKDMNKELTYANIVTSPAPADKKTYPIRWLIVLASTVAANLFLLLIIALMDVRKKIIQ